MSELFETVRRWIARYPVVYDNLKYVGVLLLAYISYLIVHKVILKTLQKLTSRTKTLVDDIILNDKVIRNLSYIVPLYILHSFAHLGESFQNFIQLFTSSLIVLCIILSLGNIISSLTDYYSKDEKFARQPVKGYGQIVKIILYIYGVLFIAGIFTGEKPWVILTGLGAISAIILLIFKDTILAVVASIQISSYELFKLGDWVEMPAFGADGIVVDIALHIIKVQNWDKTYTLVPTYKLMDSSFKNWRGMEEAGLRRIKRSVNIDMNSISFLSEDMEKRLAASEFLPKEIKDLVKGQGGKNSVTNLRVFLEYMKIYLSKIDDLSKDQTLTFRPVQSTPEGLPLELYAFSRKTNFMDYEKIQIDIFDHVLAVLPLFGLSVFQKAGGVDFKHAIN